MTLTPIAERLVVELSLPVYDLDELSRLKQAVTAALPNAGHKV